MLSSAGCLSSIKSCFGIPDWIRYPTYEFYYNIYVYTDDDYDDGLYVIIGAIRVAGHLHWLILRSDHEHKLHTGAYYNPYSR